MGVVICLENIGKTGAYDIEIDKVITYNFIGIENNFKKTYKFLAPQ